MRIKEIYALAAIGVVSLGCDVHFASAQTLGDVGAASAISSGMEGGSNAGTLAVGNRLKQDARRLGGSTSLGNPGAAEALSGDPAAAPGAPGAPGAGNPQFPSGVGEAGGAGGTAAAKPRHEPLHWGAEKGEDYVRELRSSGGASGTSHRRRTRLSARQQAARSRRLSHMTAQQRKKMINAKYKKPPVGYLAYYLPEDRYKVASHVWQFVSIEDDRGRYPVKYYYRPWAASFLRILGSTPTKSQARYNRVIGFHTWQDAMQAGYRPDPISKPEPGQQLVQIARLTHEPQLAHYLEWLYAGQITPDAFTQNFAYIQQVSRLVNAKKYTRPYMSETIGLVLGAAIGENDLPAYIGPGPVQQDNQNGGMGAPGGAPGMPGGPMEPAAAPGAPPMAGAPMAGAPPAPPAPPGGVR